MSFCTREASDQVSCPRLIQDMRGGLVGGLVEDETRVSSRSSHSMYIEDRAFGNTRIFAI